MKRVFAVFRVFFLGCGVVGMVLNSVGVLAAKPSEADLEKMAANGIIWYNPNGEEFNNAAVINDLCNPQPEMLPGGTISTGKTSEFFDRWHDTAVQVQILYGIPWEAVMAQAALESAWGTSHFATTKNAYFGVNAVDTNPDAGYSYATIELSWYGQAKPPSYAEWIRDVRHYREKGAFNFVDDPFGYLNAIQKPPSYASASDYVKITSNIINNLIRPHSAKNGWADSKGVADANPQAGENAQKNAQGANVGEGSSAFELDMDECLDSSMNTGVPVKTDNVPFDIIQGVTYTTSCFNYNESFRKNPHGGIDIRMPTGSNVYSNYSGVVRHAGWQNANDQKEGFGLYVMVEHDGGLRTYYGHFSKLLVANGEEVSAGQLIGLSGSTGFSTGPHLHYEVRQNGTGRSNRVNPMGFIGDISSINSRGCK